MAASSRALLNEVVARVNIAVVFYSNGSATLGGVDAQRMDVEVVAEHHVEVLDVDLSDVVAHPLVED